MSEPSMGWPKTLINERKEPAFTHCAGFAGAAPAGAENSCRPGVRFMLACALLSTTALLPLAAQAQDRPDAAPPAGAQDATHHALGEIIVTAQRRAESAQDAAIAIDVIAPESLAAVTSPEDLTQLAPALQISNAAGSTPILYVRGVGSFSTDPFTDSAVAVNFDDVYLGRPTGSFGHFYDLERIEVLKGPQGTLYGRNATGGALNIIPRKPSFTGTAVSGQVSYGNHDAFRAEAALNHAPSDHVALRLSGTAYSHDAYNTDGTYTEEGVGGRFQVLVEPSSDLSIRIAGDYFDLGGTGPVGTLIGTIDPLTGEGTSLGLAADTGPYDPVSQNVLNSIFIPTGGRSYGPLPERPLIDSQFYGLSSHIEAGLGFADLTVIGAWRRNDQNNVVVPGQFSQRTNETDEQFSAEVRLAGDVGPVDWLLGTYFFDESIKATQSPHLNQLALYNSLDAQNTSFAAFGRLEFQVMDELRLTGAARYTKDTRTFTGFQESAILICIDETGLCPGARILPGNIQGLDTALNSIGYVRVPQDELPPGFPPAYFDATGQSQSIYGYSLIEIDERISPDKITYRLGVEWEPGPDSLLYASYETGYRAGGFSFSTISPFYGPETIDAFTLGAKNRFFDDKLLFNIEAFLWKYDDQQVSYQTVTQTGPEFITENIGASTNKGFEIELLAKPFNNTLLQFDVQYLHAKTDKFTVFEVDVSGDAGLPPGTIPPAINCPFTLDQSTATYTLDCSNLRALRSPKWTFNAGIQQTVPLGNDFDLILQAGTRYQSDSIVMFERRPFSVVEGYWKTDAAITLAPVHEQWNVTAFVDNIERDRTVANTFYSSTNGLVSAIYNPPRTYGARVQFAF